MSDQFICLGRVICESHNKASHYAVLSAANLSLVTQCHNVDLKVEIYSSV